MGCLPAPARPRRPPARPPARAAEWHFRSSLDRYVWVFGMLCALGHPAMSALLTYIDGLPKRGCYAARGAIAAACAAIGYAWYTHIFVLPKNDYNRVGEPGWAGLGAGLGWAGWMGFGDAVVDGSGAVEGL